MYPTELRYTAEHEWVRYAEGVARVGITDYAQEALGDIVYVDLPAVGAQVARGKPFGEVESTKSVSEVFAPLDGTVTARNESLTETPELVNSDPYGEGWIIEIRLADPSGIDALLDADAYNSHVQSQH